MGPHVSMVEAAMPRRIPPVAGSRGGPAILLFSCQSSASLCFAETAAMEASLAAAVEGLRLIPVQLRQFL